VDARVAVDRLIYRIADLERELEYERVAHDRCKRELKAWMERAVKAEERLDWATKP
jgi:hypothetical protein